MSLELAATFAALGDPTRLALVERLRGAEALAVGSLAEGLPMSRQAVSKHLAVLAEGGVVSASREGRQVLYRLEPARVAEAEAFLQAVGERWDAALGRLKAHVER
ncbi:ArsR/SmtB family transcription factor [Pseudoroseicyclus sp. CXY001]|uniref:ArsR/SmtB family transcription factor n=1 Tax=Pseudoroseicyclus sp. CXY001 TaxID=3242492 RepID=UPI003570BCF5